MLGLEAANLDLDIPADLAKLSLTARQQIFLHEDIEGVCLLSLDGNKIYSSFANDFEALESTRQSMFTTHIEQNIPFGLFSYSDHGAKHLVLSRSLFDKRGELKAIFAMVVETDRFFDVLGTSFSNGIISAILYHHDGQIFALWNAPDSVQPEHILSVEMNQIEEIPIYREYISQNPDGTTLQGGNRLFFHEDMMVSFAQTANFPITLGLLVHIPSALGSFDRLVVVSVSVVFLLILIALFLNYRFVQQTKQNDILQQHMVDELSVQVQQRTAQLEQILGKDSLTGLMNRHICGEAIENAIEKHESSGESFCIIGMDVDGFKVVNDTYGHVMGDKVLIHITSLLTEILGDSGVLSRWGGDELLALLPNCPFESAYGIAQQMREAIDQTPFSDEIACTVSFGVAEHQKGESATAIVRRADFAMYDAKAAGKNCVRPVVR